VVRILVITNLFPNSLEPNRGLFNLQQLEALREEPDVSIRVVSPTPWSPGVSLGERWRRYSELPAEEEIHGFKVYHPRYVVIPKVLRSLYGVLFYLGIKGCVDRLRREFPFDVILATWAYPDAFGSVLLSRRIGVPCLVKVHGTDINHHTRHLLRRMMITWALRRAPSVIAVSDKLKRIMVRCGIPEDSITVLQNGVDAATFVPMPRDECRRTLSLDPSQKIILYVGYLKESKGILDLLEAFDRLDRREKLKLVYVGDGPDSTLLDVQLRRRGLSRSVDLVGARPHEEIPVWMNACDLLCLPSHNEGCPNVVLEALACGTPIVATRVGEIPNLVRKDQGFLVQPKDIESLSDGLRRGLRLSSPLRSDTDALISWQDNAATMHKLLNTAVHSHGELS
jgi:glycosyltransferase involved in cell wall biosynthesis